MGQTSTFCSRSRVLSPSSQRALVSREKEILNLVYVIYSWHLLRFPFSPSRLRLWAYKKDKLIVLRNITNATTTSCLLHISLLPHEAVVAEN